MKTTPTKKTKRKTKRIGVRLLAFLVSIACLVPAQTPTDTGPSNSSSSRAIASRAIEGTVLSSSRAPVPGAIVQIKDMKTLQVRSYIAQQDGKYHFWGLSTDVNYQLRAMAGGLASKTKTVSVFNSRSKVTLNLKLTKKFKP